ncbi:protein disulfide-isomerase [Salarias fasciatus]|uniref:protein disulfide-isomerase n=1 Tax=Salarias fasciatus TaxID=181472 RepID=UPI001176A184|nr:protein disulfide-isomerase-like [Salarias fasciatus]
MDTDGFCCWNRKFYCSNLKLLDFFIQLDQQTDPSYHGEEEEDGILQLGKKTFERTLRKHTQLLVYFYTPLFAEGHRVLEAFEGAAAELQGSEVKLAVLDVTKEKELAEELNATDQLTIRLYLSGDKHEPVLCPVPQSPSSILTWLKRREGTAADLLADLSQAEASEELTVVGFFKELDQECVKLFYSAAMELPHVSFVVTQDEEAISKYDLRQDAVLLLKKSKLIQTYKMSPDSSKEELVVFITVYRMDPVTEYSGQTASQILSSPVSNHALLFVNKSSVDYKDISSAFSRAAEAFRLKILFVLVDVAEPRNGRIMEYFLVRDFEAPLIRIVNLTDHVTYHLPSETLDEDTIRRFSQSYLEGRAKPKMKSEPIPEGWEEKPVKELVGATLEEVAFHPNKTVFVLFYLPYSKASLALLPLWEDLAEAFTERDDVVIARIDASANEVNVSVQRAYPSLCLFPALYAERVVIYTGEKNLEDLVKFVHEEMETAKEYRVKEDEDRRRYAEALKAEEAKQANQSKNTRDEL